MSRHHGWPLEGYWEEGHPVQRRARAEVARWMNLEAADLGVGVDGCGVVTFAASLESAALAYARLARASHEDGAPGRVLAAMHTHPWFVGGTGRLCTALMEAGRGRVVAKVGAEGVYCAAILPLGLGIALKVDDGAKRASEVALLEVLRQLDVLDDESYGRLASFAKPTVLNTRGQAVGRIQADLALQTSAVHG